LALANFTRAHQLRVQGLGTGDDRDPPRPSIKVPDPGDRLFVVAGFPGRGQIQYTPDSAPAFVPNRCDTYLEAPAASNLPHRSEPALIGDGESYLYRFFDAEPNFYYSALNIAVRRVPYQIQSLRKRLDNPT